MKELKEYLGENILEKPQVAQALEQANGHLAKYGVTREILKDRVVAALVASAEKVCRDTVHFNKNGYNEGDRKLDHVLTSRFTGYPVMIGMLAVVFWLTITGANYPSQMLADALFRVQDLLTEAFMAMGAPVAPRPADPWSVPGTGMGGIRNAAPHGDLLPPVHPVRGLRLPAQDRL